MCVCVNIKVIIHVEEKQCMGGGIFPQQNHSNSSKENKYESRKDRYELDPLFTLEYFSRVMECMAPLINC